MILFQEYNYNNNSKIIDLSSKSLDKIDKNTFKGLINLESLYLNDNKIKQLENGLFNQLSNLRELWLESNKISSIDRDIFVGLNKLQKVCLNDNPISLMFPINVEQLCDTNPNCNIKINEKCIKDTTSKE
jgi:Leucine-rich repeat (LRR) protein